LKIALYLGALLGVALLVTLAVRVDLASMVHVLAVAGWPLFALLPYRVLYFLPYAVGWAILLRGLEGGSQVGLAYLFWVATVREGVDRLLPVASVGGGVIGVRLLRWRGVPMAEASASIIVEVLLTLFALYLFIVVGVLLLLGVGMSFHEHSRLLIALVLTLPVPLVMAWLLRYGSLFERMHGFLLGLVGTSPLSEGAAALDREIRAILSRHRALLVTGFLQFLALLSGSFEIWFALWLFGHPVDWKAAIALESLTQAVRHVAFVIPAGLGVQEAGLILFGKALGIDAELALAVSMAKRLREVLLGVASLLSWQWQEARQIHKEWRARG
jgi:putative membrane protein